MVSKRENSGESGTLDSIQFVDGFGNLIQTKAEHWYYLHGAQIITDVFYDVMGRFKKQSNPDITILGSQDYRTPSETAYGIVYNYDSLGRPVLTVNPDHTQVSRTFNHWVVTETDENGHAKSYLFDAFQRLVQVTENNFGESYVTTYVYSPLGELRQTTDHLKHVTTMEYDTLGRKKRMIEPNLGTWTYSYDRVGNLAQCC